MAEMYANGGGGTNLKEFFERAQDPEELVKALQNAARERNLPAFSEPAMQVLRDQEITGPDLLLMTKEEIIRFGMKGGPSTRIMALVEEARGLHSSHGSEFGSLQPLRGGDPLEKFLQKLREEQLQRDQRLHEEQLQRDQRLREEQLQRVQRLNEEQMRHHESVARGIAAVAGTVTDLVRSMRYRAMCPDKETARSTESQAAFKNALVARYQAGFCRNGKRFISAPTSFTHIQCAVTGWKTSKQQCCAGHLLPHASAHDALAFGLSPDDINDERNGLLLAQGVEKVMHPPLRVCFLFDVLNNSWKFAVLDPELMKQVVRPTPKRFHELHQKALEIPPGKSPWKRLLWVHAEHAISGAMKKGWIKGQAWEEELKKLASLLDQVNGKSDSDMAMRIWIANSISTAEGPVCNCHDPLHTVAGAAATKKETN